ncbi:MAG: hypothetical protein AAF456_04155 [Planctomycetota bacterium]
MPALLRRDWIEPQQNCRGVSPAAFFMQSSLLENCGDVFGNPLKVLADGNLDTVIAITVRNKRAFNFRKQGNYAQNRVSAG